MYVFGPNTPANGIDVLGKFWRNENDWWESVGRGFENLGGEIEDGIEDAIDGAKKAAKDAWKGTIHVDDECTEDGLKNYRYLSEDEANKELRRLPTGGKEVEADALYMPGKAWKIPNYYSVHITCNCDGEVTNIVIISGLSFFGEDFIEWKAGDSNVPSNWPDQDTPPYQTSPPGPELPPLDPS